MSRSASLRIGPCSLVCLWLSACGPTVGADGSDTAGATGSSDDVIGDPPPVTSTTTVPPATSTSTTSPPDPSGAETDVDDTGTDFLMIPDGGCTVLPDGTSAHCVWDCSVVLQDCPPDEKCVPWANDGGDVWNATRCVAVDDDPAAEGEPCTMEGSPTSGIDDCDAASMCWNVDPETLEGTCVSFCDEKDPSTCAAEQICMVANDGVISICLPTCDPLVLDSCPTDQACIATENAFVCVPSADGGGGVPCDADNCAPGQTCAPSGALLECPGVACCTPWCDLTAPDPDLACAAVAGHTCQPFYPPGTAPEGLEHIGYCGVP